MSRFTPPGECPVCGAEVPRKARACPECGACEEAGWGEDTYLDGVELPDEESAAHQRRRAWEQPKRPLALPLIIAVLLALVFSGLWFLQR